MMVILVISMRFLVKIRLPDGDHGDYGDNDDVLVHDQVACC